MSNEIRPPLAKSNGASVRVPSFNASLCSVKPTVTEHALFRYCERVMGANRDWIISRIKNQLPTEAGRLVNGIHWIEDRRARAVVEDNNVVTILLPGEQYQKRWKGSDRHLAKRYA